MRFLNDYFKSNQIILLAAICRNHQHVETLINAGADVNIQNNHDQTALVWALTQEKDRSKCVNILIQAGADVNTQNSNGDTSVILPGRNGSDKCIEALIAAGADVSIENHKGERPLILVLML